MGLREQIQKDVDAILNVNEFAETIGYRANGEDEWEPISAIVHREAMSRIGETSNTQGFTPQITVSRTDVRLVVRDGDAFRLAPVIGGEEEIFLAAGIESQSSARFRLRLKAG